LLTDDGIIYVCGSNDSGQLGINENKYELYLRQVPLDFRICEIKCGIAFTLILTGIL
jgi:hypothetical protein